MSKLKLAILATIVAYSGFELRQTATAAQSSTQLITKATQNQGIITETQFLALKKPCTLKRYRRPR